MIPDLWVFDNFLINLFETCDIGNKFLFTIEGPYNFFDSFLIGNKEFFLNKLNINESISEIEKLIFC